MGWVGGFGVRAAVSLGGGPAWWQLRVVTWNPNGGPRTGADVVLEAIGDEVVEGIARPLDILLLQEASDDGGVDSFSQVQTVMDLLRYGGPDPFVGGTVTSYILAFTSTPGYDLPFVYILGDSADDNFNKNIILSRYPIADINGDGIAAGDTIGVQNDLWAPGGNGGVRGFPWAEIDLPDDVYAGDVVVGNSHLKAFSGCSDYTQRLTATRNISYFIEHYWNGDQGPTTDPRNRITFPSSGNVLDANTPVIWGGDWNNNPFFSGPGGCTSALNPVEYMIEGGGGSGDGTDRDGSNSFRDFATVPGTSDSSTQSGSKLDYLAWQDSIAIAVEQFIFRTNTPFPYPPAVANGPRPNQSSSNASDHRPVIVDFVLPLQAASGPPILSSFTPDPASVAFNQTIDFTLNAFDPDGSIVGDIEFFEDTNNNGNFDGGDALIGTETPSAPAGASVVLFQIAPSDFLPRPQFDALVGSTKRIFARAQDNQGQFGSASVEISPILLAPEIDSFSATPNSVDYVTPLLVQATASDSDGSVVLLEVLFDTNDNNTLDAGDDVVASVLPAMPSGSAVLSESFVIGDVLTPAEYNARLGSGNRIFVRATDDSGLTDSTALSVSFVNTPPIVDNFVATPNPIAPDQLATITADIIDVDGTVSNVAFYLDNGDGIPNLAEDQLIGSVFAPPFQAFWFTSGTTPGDQQDVLVEVFDDDFAITVEVITIDIVGACQADFNNDGAVNLGDFGLFGAAFGSSVGDPNYNPAADLNDDGSVNLGDFGTFGSEFGRTDC